MKKIGKVRKLLILLTIVATPIVASRADFSGPSEQAVMTVAQVSKMRDDRAVVMMGTIEKHLKKDKYQFVDSTGRIVVEIDGDTWRGMDVTPNDTVLIVGETDKDWFRDVQVDVSSIKKVGG